MIGNDEKECFLMDNNREQLYRAVRLALDAF